MKQYFIYLLKINLNLFQQDFVFKDSTGEIKFVFKDELKKSNFIYYSDYFTDFNDVIVKKITETKILMMKEGETFVNTV